MENKQIVKTDKPHFVFSIEADRDYIIARLVNFTGSAFSSRAGYFSQQALEKYLKASSVQHSGEYSKSHNLLELSKHCSQFDPEFADKEFLERLKIFNDFIDLGRYGGEASFDPHAKTTKDFKTAGVIIWVDTNIKILDKLVYKIRGELNFAGFSDNLQAILNEDKKNYFVRTWRFPIPLKNILSSENKYFK